MELHIQKKLAQHIFRLLKVNEIVIPIGRTPKGNLGLKFSSNSDDFEMLLDSVPLSVKDSLNDENNIELKRMLEKYLFEAAFAGFETLPRSIPTEVNSVTFTPNPPKKRGRPAKVK